MAFYNNTADSDLGNDGPLLKVPDESDRFKEAGALRRRILDLKKAIWESGAALRDNVEWTGLKQLAVTSNNSTEYAVVEKQARDEFHTVGTVEIKTHTRIDVPGSSFGGEEIRALQLTVLPWDPETAIHSPEWGFVVDDLEAWVTSESGCKTPVVFRLSVPDVPWMPTDPMQSIGPNGQHWGADTLIHHARQLALVPEQPILVKEGETLSLYIHCNKRGAGGSHPMAIQRGHLASSSDDRWEKLGDRRSMDYRRSQKLNEALTRFSEIPGTTIPIMHRRPIELARPTHVFIRGNALEKGAEVFAGLPVTLTEVVPVEGSLDRLAMARWWVSDDHPLTSRAFVNRLWEQLFGVGIVPTLEDFGSSGEKPTHPELLDYLAVRFQKDHNWSVKAILQRDRSQSFLPPVGACDPGAFATRSGQSADCPRPPSPADRGDGQGSGTRCERTPFLKTRRTVGLSSLAGRRVAAFSEKTTNGRRRSPATKTATAAHSIPTSKEVSRFLPSRLSMRRRASSAHRAGLPPIPLYKRWLP